MRRHAAWTGPRAAVFAALLATVIALGAAWAGTGLTRPPAHPSTADVELALEAAAAAVRDRDEAAWRAALPAEGPAAQAAWNEVFTGLTRYDWRDLRAMVTPDDTEGTYYVQFRGRFSTEKSRTVAVRVLDMAWRDGRVTAVGDSTSAWGIGFGALAFTDPVVMVRDHLVVVGERSQWKLMRVIADCDGQAPRVARALGLERQPRTLFYVCTSLGQARAAAISRISNYGQSAFAIDAEVYVVARRFAPEQKWAPDMVRHELAHVYRPDFASGRHNPELLREGLAVVVEGVPTYEGLRIVFEYGKYLLPLVEALTLEDVWAGRSDIEIAAAYLQGGSLVRYLKARWGVEGMEAFAAAIADSDATPAGVRRATRESLGVGWKEFHAGWKRFVWTLP